MSESKDAFQFVTANEASHTISNPIEQIPTPDKLPKSATVDPDSIRESNEFSTTFDTLLQQNHDLMNRLSVALKRAANLEARIQHAEKTKRGYEERVHSFGDEISVLNKSIYDLQIQLRRKKDELTESERDYGDLHSRYVEQRETTSEAIRKLSRFRRYRHRIATIVRPYVRSLKQNLILLRDSFAKLEAEVDSKTYEITNLKHEVSALKNTISENEDSHAREIEKIINEKEAEITDQRDKELLLNQSLESANERFRKAEHQIRELQQRNVSAENALRAQERRNKTLEEKFDADLDRVQKRSLEFHQRMLDYKDRVAELETENSRLQDVEAENQAQRANNEKLEIRLKAKEFEYEDLKARFDELDRRFSQMTIDNRLLNDQVVSFAKAHKDSLKAEEDTLEHVEKLLKNLHEVGSGTSFSASEEEQESKL